MESSLFNKQFTIGKEAYRELIKELSEVIERPYMATFKAFERLEPQQVASILEDSKKWGEQGFKSRSMAVWTMRKKLLDK